MDQAASILAEELAQPLSGRGRFHTTPIGISSQPQDDQTIVIVKSRRGDEVVKDLSCGGFGLNDPDGLQWPAVGYERRETLVDKSIVGNSPLFPQIIGDQIQRHARPSRNDAVQLGKNDGGIAPVIPDSGRRDKAPADSL